MNDNAKLPADRAPTFLKEALNKGCYTVQQAGQIEGVWKVVVKRLAAASLDTQKLTIGELQQRGGQLLLDFGAISDTKAGTIQTYTSRLKAFLADFVKWHGGNFMDWKIENAKKANGRGKKVKTSVAQSDGQSAAGHPTGGAFKVYEIAMGSVSLGAIHVLPGMNKADFEFFWGKVEAKKKEIMSELTDAAGQASPSAKEGVNG